MNCKDCSDDPWYNCSCSDINICLKHMGEHLQKPGDHNYKKLHLKMTKFQRNILDLDLKTIIQRLETLKKEIFSKTAQVIKKIESESNNTIQKIDNLIPIYVSLLRQSKLKRSSTKGVKDVNDSEIILNEFKIEKLLSTVKKTYSKNLIRVEVDPGKVRLLQQSKFLSSHNGGFNCVAIFNEGENLVSGCDDSSVRVWDLANRNQIMCLTKHKASVDCLAVSRNSLLIASGSFDKSVIVWNTKSWKNSIFYSQNSGAVLCLAFSPDSKLIISGSSEKQITIWDIKSKTFVEKIITTSSVYCGIISSENNYFSGIGEELYIWNVKPFVKVKSKKIHDSDINSIALFKNEKFIVTGSDDHSAKIWDIQLSKLYACLNGHTEPVSSVSVTYDNKLVITASLDETIIIWSFDSKSKIQTLAHHQEHIYGITTFDGSLFSASRDSRIGVSKLSGEPNEYFLHLKPFTLRSLVFKNKLAAYGCLNDVVIYNFNDHDHEIVLQGHSGIVQETCFSENFSFLVSCSTGTMKNLIIWDLKMKKVRNFLNGHQVSVFCVDISRDEKKVISGDQKGIILLWSVKEYKQIIAFESHSSDIYSVKFSNNGDYAVSGGLDKKVLVWDIAKMILHASFDDHRECIEKVFFTEDDKSVIAAGNFYGIHVWSIVEKVEINAFKSAEDSEEWLNQHKLLKSELLRYLV